MIDKSFLEAYEADIASCYERGDIRAPVHLAGGNEQQLLDIFKRIGPADWVCLAWRSHYHCLLKGVPQEELKKSILAGWSITLNYPKYKILTSAIAGGVIPQAVGIAEGIKKHGGSERVWCFVGDMTCQMGIFQECEGYAIGFNLPITFIVEDNDLSVCTNTSETWGNNDHTGHWGVEYYSYKMTRPHQGIGKRISF